MRSQKQVLKNDNVSQHTSVSQDPPQLVAAEGEGIHFL